jgi:hypothetical protein
MRNVVLGIVAGFVVVWVFSSSERQPNQLFAQYPATAGADAVSASGDLIALGSDVAEGRQQVTVIDPRSLVMTVYHVEHATGTISLKSVRNIRADLLMDVYNTASPLPREIRAILKQKQ